MKHFIIPFLLLISLKIWAQAESTQVGEPLALTIAAKQFALFKGHGMDYRSLKPYIIQSETRAGKAVFHVVGFSGIKGIVIVSGSKATPPVLATLETADFDTATFPPAMKWYLKVRADNIAKSLDGDPSRFAADIEQHRKEWQYVASELFELTEANNSSSVVYDTIPPLLHTNWGQSYPYNAHCPVLVAGRVPAGCGPIAMAQIMRYHEYPNDYDWSEMGEEHTEYNHELASLISDCGEAAGTDYTYLGSATMPWDIDDALQDVFEYPLAKYHDIPNAGKKGGWEYKIKRNLEDGFPVIVHGYEEWNMFDWHIFVMDGYSGLPNGWMGLFHINWGWDGSKNGWFLLEDCNPSGDNGPYNYNQGAVYRIIPPAHVELASPLAGSAHPSKNQVPIAWTSMGRAADMDSAMIVIYQENYSNTRTGHQELNYDTIRGLANFPGQNIYLHMFENPHAALFDTVIAWAQVIVYGHYGDNAHYRFFSEPVSFGIYHGEFMTFTAPVSGTIWQAKMQSTIAWNYNLNTSPLFTVKFKKVNGPANSANSGVIVADTAGSAINWFIPGGLEGTYYLEGIKKGFPEIRTYSDHFTIAPPPTMQVTLPLVNQLFQPGDILAIRWNSNLQENVKIILQRWDDWDPTDVTLLAASTPNDGVFDWTIPSIFEPGTLYSVVVEGTIHPQITNGVFYFTIRPLITVNTPVSGAEWELGKEYYINWSDNIAEDVVIKLYQGTTLHSTISTGTASDGSFAWLVPGTLNPGVNYRIRIHKAGDETVGDYSDFFSVIATRFIHVTTPAANVVWQKGQTYNIQWTSNVPNGFKVELLDTRFIPHTVTLIHNFTYSGHPWTVPTGITPHSLYKIRVTSFQFPNVADSSDFFTIENPPSITVTQPVSTTSWPTATTQNITWTDNLSGNVNIYLYRRYVTPGLIATLATNIPSDGTFGWNIAPTLTPSPNYYVIVRSVDFPTIQDASDDFTITQGSYITVTAPAAGTSWQAGTSNKIRWNDNIAENVRIILRKPSMGIEDTIAHSTASTGNFMWSIPANTMPATNYNIFIQSVTTPQVSDYSDPFEIYNTSGFFITVTSPGSDSVWKIGTQHTVTWDDNVYGFVTVALYNNTTLVQTMGTTGSNSLTWTVPTTMVPPGNQYKVKVTWNNNNAVHDYSMPFTIAPADFIDYTGPGAYRMNDTVNITWTDNIPEYVRIELYHADTLYSVITPSTESDGSFTWGVPSSLPAEQWYKIKISRTGGTPLSDISPPVPIYYPYFIDVTSPSAGQMLLKGSSYAIEWTFNMINNEHYRLTLFKGADSVASIVHLNTSGYCLWNIGVLYEDLVAGDDYSIRVACFERPQVVDFSEVFGIVDCDSIDFTIGNDTTVYIGGQVNLIATDGFPSYLWLPFQGVNRVLNLGPTWFSQPDTIAVTCMATYTTGCVKQDTLNLIIAEPPCQANATFSFNAFRGETICNHYSFLISGDSVMRYRYLWDFGDVTTADTSTLLIDHIYPGPGTYVVQCTAYDPVFPDCQLQFSDTITIHAAPVIDFLYSIAIDTGTFIPVITGNGHYQWNWYIDSIPAVNILHDSLAGDTMRVIFPENRSYQVCLDVFDTLTRTCLFTHCEDVVVTTIPPCRSTTCYFGKKPLYGYGSGNRNTFRFKGGVDSRLICSQVTWNLGDGTPPFTGTMEFDHTFAPGDYVVMMKVTNCDTCVYIHRDTIHAREPLDAGLPPAAQGCDSVVLTPVQGLHYYTWQDSTHTATYTARSSGSYDVTVLDGSGFYRSDTTVVAVAPTLNVTMGTIPVLCGDGLTYNLVEGIPAGGIYTGSFVTGSTFSIVNAGPGFFPVRYYFANNLGCSDTAGAVIEVEPVFTGTGYHQNITYTGQHYFTGDSVLAGFNVTSSLPAGPVVFNAGSVTTLKGQERVILRPGTVIQQNAGFHALTGPLSCLVSQLNPESGISASVTGHDESDNILVIPNPAAISATLHISPGTFDGMYMSVYNPYGMLVDEKRSLTGNNITFGLETYSPGIYIIRLEGGERSYSLKLIVR